MEDTPRADEKRAQPGDDPICGTQVGRALAPSIEDQQLMPEHLWFSGILQRHLRWGLLTLRFPIQRSRFQIRPQFVGEIC
jgi:hypothetical protein